MARDWDGQVQRLSSREWRTIETLFFANPFQLFGSHSLKIEKKIGILFQAERKRERPEGLRPQDYLESYFALGSKGSLMVCRCTVCRRVGKDRNTLDLSETVQHV